MDGWLMSALELYKKLSQSDQSMVDSFVRNLANVSPDTDIADIIDHDDHPALVEALRRWWESSWSKAVFLFALQKDDKVNELALLLIATSVAHLFDESVVNECCRVRLAWVRGEASDDDRFAAIEATRRASLERLGNAYSAYSYAASAAYGLAVMPAAWDASLAVKAASKTMDPPASKQAMMCLSACLWNLVPDLCAVSHRDALTRWSDSTTEVQKMIRSICERGSR